MPPLAVPASKVLARLHRWWATAFLLAGVPLARLDRHSVGRLSYALMMLAQGQPSAAQRILQRVIAGNNAAPAALLLDLSDMAVRVGDNAAAMDLLQRARATSTDALTADAALRLLALLQSSMDGSLAAAIAEKVKHLNIPEDGRTITLVPVSYKYLEMWALWIAQTRRHVCDTVVALTMDTAAADALRDQPGVYTVGIEEFFAWDERGGIHPRTRGVLWYVRVLYLRELVRRGFTALVLDLDAIAIADLQPMLAKLPPADVVAQKDHSIPMDVERQLGFVLCCGFVLVRPTPAAMALMDRWAAATATERDDQLALNHMLGRDGLADRVEDETGLRFGSAGVQFVCPPPSQVSRSLDTGAVIRHFHQDGKSVGDIRAALRL